MHLRPYTDADCPHLLALWEQALPGEAILREEFERRVLLDANREPDSLMLAVEGDRLVGFILCLVLRYPIENTGTLEHRGFITAFGVHPEHRGRGVGSALLAHAEAFCRARHRTEVALAPYTPNYFVPGVDKARYPEGLAFLVRRGFVEFSEAIAMDAPVGQFDLDAELLEREQRLRGEGIVIEPFRRERMVDYLDFMNRVMPGPWLEDARRNLRDFTRGLFPEDGILLACHEGRIIGYCQFEAEHFGPFGVEDGWQGKGIGTVLLARTLYRMRLKGHHSAYVLWTGERAAKGVYGRLGFTVSRRFAVLRKMLPKDAS
ncbi:MAG: GNAT family N-acetyltransferase [Candidatus Sumerlaeia bacterium]|nr:GNAT family N-acetyltransferase [Candidatus Sumerlaeia bacterium]